jgi:hypothetical protein
MKRKENEFFTTTLYEIDRVLEDKRLLEDDPDNVDLLCVRCEVLFGIKPRAYQESVRLCRCPSLWKTTR